MKLFRQLDEKFLRKQAEAVDDEAQLVDLVRQSRTEIARVFAADKETQQVQQIAKMNEAKEDA